VSMSLRSLIQSALRGALLEVFEEIDKTQMSFSLGFDVFEHSHFELKNLRVKQSLFKQMGFPVDLVGGSIDRLTIKGLSNLITGGDVTLEIDEIYLLATTAQAASCPDTAIAVTKWLLACQAILGGHLYDEEFVEAALKLAPKWRDQSDKKTSLQRKIQHHVTKKLLSGLQVVLTKVHIR
jgi:N-terminal region of Chorein or VPS13